MRKLGMSILATVVWVGLVAGPAGADRDGGYGADGKDKDRKEHSGDGGGDCADAKNCSDDDFSPRFDESPLDIVICVQPGSCRFDEGGEEEG